MPATLRQFNWRAVTITPTAGSATVLTGVTQVGIDENSIAAKFSGDGDQGPTTVIREFVDAMITIALADIAKVRALTGGTRGAFSAIFKDAKQTGATAATGDITFAIGDPKLFVVNNPISGAHRQFGGGQLLLCTEWADGATNPLSSAVTA